MIDRDHFFGALKQPLFGGHYAQPQVDGMNAILDGWEANLGTDKRHLAYMLATAYLETARTMQPIHEYGGAKYFHDRYDPEGKHPDIAKQLGNTQPGDGARFAGRGYVQLTGRANYAKAGAKVGADLIGNPDLALQPAIAAKVMFTGMTEGWFTGRKLSDYFSATTDDAYHARRIINGLDSAAEIQALHNHFLAALSV